MTQLSDLTVPNVWHLSAPSLPFSGCRLLTVSFLPAILEVSVLVRGGTLGEDVGPAPPVGGQLHPHVTRVKGVHQRPPRP
jgi:hypothetical protein